jgi:hypothetical protein
MHDLRDVGGTRGGLTHFVIGLALTALGGYLFLDRVSVHGGYWRFMGSQSSSFGITLIPLLIGIGMLFYDGSSKLGWVLTVGTFLLILAGIIANLQVHYQGTSLWGTLIMLGLFAGGIGLVLRSVRTV